MPSFNTLLIKKGRLLFLGINLYNTVLELDMFARHSFKINITCPSDFPTKNKIKDFITKLHVLHEKPSYFHF